MELITFVRYQPPDQKDCSCQPGTFGYGIGRKILRWIDSFLCYRTQRTVANGETSVWAPVLSCVPQGTVLPMSQVLVNECH